MIAFLASLCYNIKILSYGKLQTEVNYENRSCP